MHFHPLVDDVVQPRPAWIEPYAPQLAQLGQFEQFLPANLPRLVKSIRVDTRRLPTFGANDPFGPGPSATGPIGRFFKPQFTIEVQGMSRPIVSAPYGSPGPTRWPLVKVVGGVVLVIGGVLAFLGVRSVLR